MSKTLLFAGAAFLVGAGAGGAFGIVRAPDAADAEAHGASDPDDAGSPVELNASGPAGHAGAPTDAATGEPDSAEVGQDDAPAPPREAMRPTARPVNAAEAAAADAVWSSRLARIFAAMQPGQAAKVLEELDRPEIEAILTSLDERQAAAILAAMEPERAAVLSKRLLAGAERGES